MTSGSLSSIAHDGPPLTPDGGPLLQTWRLTRWNLYLTRRRLMSKIIVGLLAAAYILVVAFVLFVYGQIVNAPLPTAANYCPRDSVTPTAAPSGTPQSDQPGVTGQTSDGRYVCQPPSQEQIARDQQAARQSRQQSASLFLKQVTFPTSLALAGGFLSFLGPALLCILAGILIGGEYGFSTQRLAISRGVSHAQALAAQVGALAILALLGATFTLLLGALAGLIFGPTLGAQLSAPTFADWRQMLTFWLAHGVELFLFALVALFFATLGRSTAAGIAFSLGFIVVDFFVKLVLLGVSAYLTATGQKDVGNLVGHIQDWFLSANASALIDHTAHAPLSLVVAPLAETSLDGVHALLVSLAYAALLIGGSYWLLRSRDVLN